MRRPVALLIAGFASTIAACLFGLAEIYPPAFTLCGVGIGIGIAIAFGD